MSLCRELVGTDEVVRLFRKLGGEPVGFLLSEAFCHDAEDVGVLGMIDNAAVVALFPVLGNKVSDFMGCFYMGGKACRNTIHEVGLDKV